MKHYVSYVLAILLISSCSNNAHRSMASSVVVPEIDINYEPKLPECTAGGEEIVLSKDYNKDGILQQSEVVATSALCDVEGEFKSFVVEISEPKGENCPYGGKVIKSGLDLNGDGIFDANEVTATEYLCSNEPDSKQLVEVLDEPAGSICELGGKKIISGEDTNSNSILEESEIQDISYKCNTVDDFKSVSKVIDLQFGSVECPLAGKQVVSGLDLNKNNELDDNEINPDKTLLNCLKSQDYPEVTRTNDLVFGSSECALGGKLTETGRDYNLNNSLDDNEVLSTTTLCKSNSDFNNLIVINELPVKNAKCPLGGKQTLTGLDYNLNGTLDDSEINNDATTYSCYSEADYNELSNQSAEPMGKNCSYGGWKVEKGLDFNKDGVLNTDEINNSWTSYNCLGPEDFNTLLLVSEEPFGSDNCSLGGKRTDTGLDLNSDGALSTGEISKTSFDCYSPDHYSLLSRITESPKGANCSLGGKKVEQGRDYNKSGVLEDSEIDAGLTQYNCYVSTDFNLLSRSYDEPKGGNCRLGGTRIERGRDFNFNDSLDTAELDSSLTTYTCTLSFAKSVISSTTDKVKAGSSILVTLSLVDEMGISVRRSGMKVEFTSAGGSSVGEFSPVLDRGDGTYSSLFTGILAGTPTQVSAFIEGEEITTYKPYITVNVGTAEYVSIETKADGTGSIVDTLTLTGATPVTLYAISRDAKGNFVANEAVNWFLSDSIGTLSSVSGPSTTLSPKPVNKSGFVTASHSVLGNDTTGAIKVSWTGLVVSLSFEDNTLDASGNANDAANYGATFVAGKIGKAASFNGEKVTGEKYYPYLLITDKPSLSLTTAGTLSAWVYIDQLTNFGGIIAKGNDSNTKDESYALELFDKSSVKQEFVISVKDTPETDALKFVTDNSLGTPTIGNWYYVVGTWDFSGSKIYIDGVLQGSNSNAKVAQVTASDINIGSKSKGSSKSSSFIGKIDEVNIWNRALSVDEIKYLYNGGQGR